METIVLSSVCLFLSVILIIEKVLNRLEVDKLTDKLIAKNFVEYANYKHAHEAEVTKRKLQANNTENRVRNL